jgi:hypothetical protein
VGSGSNYVADIECDLLYGYPLHGRFMEIVNCNDIPRITRCHVNPGAGFQFLGDANGLVNCPIKAGLIDAVVTNGPETFYIDNADEFMMSKCFVFGVKTGFYVNNSYGTMVNCNADEVETGVNYINSSAAYKQLSLIGFNCIPSAGPTPSARNAIKYSGGKGLMRVVGGNAYLGSSTTAVPSSSNADANAFIKITNGTADLVGCFRILTSGLGGTWTTDIDNSGGTVTGTVGTYT